jgi:hypothetical protein
MSFHIADAHAEFKAVCVGPDFCLVNKKPVPFEIFQTLVPERLSYTKKTKARSAPILTITSVIAGVIGNMGEGAFSHVAMLDGSVVLILGSTSVKAEGNYVCRDQDIVMMNAKV